ncbi:hypothetical protein BDV19DRAFT_356980 [Aspergillus venezuelensis]
MNELVYVLYHWTLCVLSYLLAATNVSLPMWRITPVRLRHRRGARRFSYPGFIGSESQL